MRRSAACLLALLGLSLGEAHAAAPGLRYQPYRLRTAVGYARVLQALGWLPAVKSR